LARKRSSRGRPGEPRPPPTTGVYKRKKKRIKPKQPFLDWLHAADSTSSDLTLQELVLEPAIYLIPECDTPEEVAAVLHELCEEIFVEQLAGWFNDRTTWPPNRSFDVLCRWFDYQHHSMLIDLCDEPLIREWD
jgi:hypothetical protein